MTSIVLNPIAAPSKHTSAARLFASLAARCSALSIDERTRYLAGAADHVDLERRMRNWDETRERRNALTLIV